MPFIPVAEVSAGASALTWSNYTPALTAVSVNPSLGSGATVYGRYAQSGSFVVAQAVFVVGTGPSAGSGAYEVSLPVAASAAYPNLAIIGSGLYFSAGTAFNVILAWFNSSSRAKVQLPLGANSGFQVSDSNPHTLAVNDAISLTMTYESA